MIETRTIAATQSSSPKRKVTPLLSVVSDQIMVAVIARAAQEGLLILQHECRAGGMLQCSDGVTAYISMRIDIKLQVAEEDIERAHQVIAGAAMDYLAACRLDLPVQMRSVVTYSPIWSEV